MKFKFFIKVLVLGLTILFLKVNAATDLYPFSSMQQQQQFNQLITQFRCLVCQNEALADSNAPLAVDLKKQIYTMVLQNKSDQDVRNYLISRYGEFVLFKPPYEQRTYLLWLAPFLFLIGGFFVMYRIVRKRT